MKQILKEDMKEVNLIIDDPAEGVAQITASVEEATQAYFSAYHLLEGAPPIVVKKWLRDALANSLIEESDRRGQNSLRIFSLGASLFLILKGAQINFIEPGNYGVSI